MTRSTQIGCFEGFLVILALIVFAFLVLPFVFMLVWNAVIPGVFNGPTLSYMQAFFLYLLLYMIGSFFRSTVSKD